MVDGRIASDVNVEESVRICQFLVKCPAFAALTPTALSGVADKMKREQHAEGSTIIRQGDPGEKFYIIRNGAVNVQRETAGGRVLVAVLKDGEFFGEAALITGDPRNATVAAATDTDLYTLDRSDFRAAIDTSPTFKDQLIRVFTQRGA
jgi:putative ABC transport system ATP-binding protein